MLYLTPLIAQGLFDRVKGFAEFLNIHGEVREEHELCAFVTNNIFIPGLSENQAPIN